MDATKLDATKLEAARRAKTRFAQLAPKGIDVVGIGIGLSGSEAALKVNLKTAPKDRSVLPTCIDGVPVIYRIVGRIRRQ
jgi:tartrate dehydratase alpha subunit/fumarate hydratase class I-like protein